MTFLASYSIIYVLVRKKDKVMEAMMLMFAFGAMGLVAFVARALEIVALRLMDKG